MRTTFTCDLCHEEKYDKQVHMDIDILYGDAFTDNDYKGRYLICPACTEGMKASWCGMFDNK